MDLAMIEGTEISDWPVSGWLLKLGIKWNGLSDGVPHRREDPDDATNALIARLLMGSPRLSCQNQSKINLQDIPRGHQRLLGK